jgi:solute carrier family 10 (sodium/bile acid cotransporter), member 7
VIRSGFAKSSEGQATLTMILKRDWFLVGLIFAAALAAFFPGPGASGGWMQPEIVTKAGISLIFLLHGLGLSFQALRAGVLNWRLHILVQSCTFILFPLFGLALRELLGRHLAVELSLGFFFLCALPSTVSSSVAMTAAAQGNVAGALFNATLSSLIGIVATPLWITWAMKASGGFLPLGPVMLNLFIWLVLPLAIGQVLSLWIEGWAKRHKVGIGIVDRLTILLLVYTSFCDFFDQHVWSSGSGSQLMILLIACPALFTLVLTVTAAASRSLGLSHADSVAAIFCGSKKSLASGVPLAKLIFGTHPGLGSVLLPIMIYHPMQLIICGALAQRWNKQAEIALPT